MVTSRTFVGLTAGCGAGVKGGVAAYRPRLPQRSAPTATAPPSTASRYRLTSAHRKDESSGGVKGASRLTVRRQSIEAGAMRVLVTGGTGFIGAALCHALTGAGHAVTVVTRDPAHIAAAAIGWERVSAAVRETDALVNLAGEPLGSRRWSVRQKAP